jgi:shikimate dehydrogenase
MAPTARTRVAGVIGAPVEHSLSPALHNAAFAATGLDWVYAAFPVAPGEAAAALAGMRALGIAGLSVTMPHKDDVARLVHEPSADVVALRAANCVVAGADGRLRGESTDGPGFVRSLGDAGVDPAGARCCVLGAGGAARAVVLALARAGAAEVVVVNRTRERAERAAALAGGTGGVAAAAPATTEILVNATSVGMGGDPALPVDEAVLHPGLVVADLVYHPRRTPLLAAAEAAGATPVDGLGMLVHQAALAFELWTGVDAPVAAMRSAALGELGERDVGAPTADPD